MLLKLQRNPFCTFRSLSGQRQGSVGTLFVFLARHLRRVRTQEVSRGSLRHDGAANIPSVKHACVRSVERVDPTRARLDASCAYLPAGCVDLFVLGANDGQHKVPSDRKLSGDLQRGGARPPQPKERRQPQDQGAP